MITLQQAQQLRNRTVLHHMTRRNADGTAMRVRVTSVRTWKTRRSEVLITAKYGIHNDYYYIDETELENWSLTDPTVPLSEPETNVSAE